MLRKTLASAGVLLLIAASSKAALVGSFQQLATGKTTDPMIYAGTFDTWAFEMQSNDLNYDTFDLRFTSPTGSFLNVGGSTFRNAAANPLSSGQEVPDTFFVLPPGTVINTLTNDNANSLTSVAVVAGAPTVIPNTGAKTIVAFFSVPQGTILHSSNFVSGQAVSKGGPIHNVAYGELAPEPISASLIAIGMTFLCCLRNGASRKNSGQPIQPITARFDPRARDAGAPWNGNDCWRRFRPTPPRLVAWTTLIAGRP